MTATEAASGPSARAIRAELRRTRRGHSDTTVWQALETAYLYLFTVLMVGSMGIVAIVQGWQDLSECPAGCRSDRLVLSVVLGVALVAIGLRLMAAIGPLVVGRPAAAFLFSAPIARGPLLRGRALGLLSVGVVAGAVCAGVLAGLGGPGSTGTALAIGLATVAGAACGLLLTGLAILGQARVVPRRLLELGGDIALVVLTVSTPLLLAGGFDPGTLLPPGSRPFGAAGVVGAAGVAGVIALVVLVVLVVVSLGVAVRAVGSLSGIHRRDLVAGGDLLSGLSGAAASLDTSLISDLLHERRFRRIGARRSRRGRWRGPAALAYRELMRALRSPWRIGLAVALVVVPYAVGRLGLPTVVPVAAVVAGYFAIRPLGAGLHAIERSAGLARSLPQRSVVRRLALAVPLLGGAVVWALLAMPALIPVTGALPAAALIWPALAASIAAGVIRSMSRPPVSYDGPLLSTPAGALPVGLIGQIFCGPDVVAACSLALVFGVRPGPYSVLLFVPLVVLAYLLARGRRDPARRSLLG